MAKTRTGTCEGCGKRRKLTYPENRTEELFYYQTPNGVMRKKLLSTQQNCEAQELLIHYYGLCSECFPQVKCRSDVARLRKQREKKQRSKVAYPIIGGPLDGQYAITDDFYHDGIFANVEREYIDYNCASHGGKTIGSNPPSMLWIHKSLLKPIISGRDR